MPTFAPATRTRLLRVTHTTTFNYDQPVERSRHRLRLRPMHDRLQHVRKFDLMIEPAVELHEYEDVFGNAAAHFEVNEPYQQLIVRATSEVELLDVDPFRFADQPIRPQIPLNWMPRERQVLAPYLTSVELPDVQLEELFEYAMDFVRSNDGDLIETLFNLNLELYRNYEYVPCSTTNRTTPYEVFQTRRGVCQDFAQLFICMARLMGVPARYVCGYVFTGNTGVERAQSDASHAWVQLYIPNVGWRGFDPTNGVLPTVDHVRVAYGRFFRDATPTEGTLYSPATESMDVDVRVEEIGSAPIDGEG